MERTYEKYAEKADTIIKLFEDAAREAQETECEIRSDWRFSPEGKSENVKGVRADLQEKTDNFIKLFKENAKRFYNEYKVKLPNDGKSHSEDIANALKIIDMTGYKLTPDILKSIMEPLKHSYKDMKLLHDVIITRGTGIPEGVRGYDESVYRVLFEYIGVNTSAIEYLNRLKAVEEIADIAGFKFSATVYNNETLVTITPDVSYSYLALPTTMRELGKMYANLENEFSDLFTKHIPTDSELILSSLE